MVNQDNPRAEGGYVCHVVTGQKHRHAAVPVIFRQEAPQSSLHRNIQSKRWLIEKENLGAVQ
ncbi:MAG: hypothetical protein BWY63_02783 [Chloroflexi bacterium ADurb.Bin360]|nr:MAG: hypothetical protein BWY63_02783 [Chloroflexi bacterium ADurb.Bin360]